jgi:hypothetical protein
MPEPTVISGTMIRDIIEHRLMGAVEGTPINAAILSLLAFAVMIMKPDIGVEQLQRTVEGTSEYITLSIAPVSKTVN